MNNYDVIVIGAGHNGLTAAALLAKAGKRVVVLEKRDVIGGLGASEEFSRGYHTAGVLHDTTSVRHGFLETLDLQRYGLQLETQPPSVFTPALDSRGLLLHHDPQKAHEEIAAFSARDADRYVEYRGFINRVRGVVNRFLDEQAPDLVGGQSPRELVAMMPKMVAFKRLDKKDFYELVRLGPMSVADWLGDWFESDLLKVSLAGPALYGAFVGPRSPGSAINLLMWECRKGPSIKGGAGFLVTALEGAARAGSVDIQTSVNVIKINVSKGGVTGIVTEDGQEFAASLVAASCDPKQTILQLIAHNVVSEKLRHRMQHFRTRGVTAKVNIALDARIELAGRPEERSEYVRTGVDLDQLEKAFDAVKYKQCSEEPILDIYIPTYSNTGFAPDGHTVLSTLVHFVPYELDGGWNYRQRELLGEKVIDTLARFAPALKDAVVATEVLTPLELEVRYGVTEGHLYHGEHALDQLLMRPTPETGRYATPIGGLFLCGSGSHPGGGITCAPGALAARAILKTK